MPDEKDPPWVDKNTDGSIGFVPADREERQKNTTSGYRENYDRIFRKKPKKPKEPEEPSIEIYSDEACAKAIDTFQERLKEADNFKGGPNPDYKEFWLTMRRDGPNILNVAKHLFTLHLRNEK